MNQQALCDAAWFSSCCSNQSLMQAIKNVKLLVCDVDGTLTDATVYTDAHAEGGRYFSTQDGFMVSYARAAGLIIALVSGKTNPSTIVRARQLGIPESLCVGGSHDKPSVTRTLQQTYDVQPEQTMAFGDDYLDAMVKIYKAASLYACPANTIFYLQPLADLIIPAAGGTHALRLVLDLWLYSNQKHPAQELIERVLHP